MVLKTLNENLSETSDAVPAPKSSDKAETASAKDSQESGGTHTHTHTYQCLVQLMCGSRGKPLTW